MPWASHALICGHTWPAPACTRTSGSPHLQETDLGLPCPTLRAARADRGSQVTVLAVGDQC